MSINNAQLYMLKASQNIFISNLPKNLANRQINKTTKQKIHQKIKPLKLTVGKYANN